MYHVLMPQNKKNVRKGRFSGGLAVIIKQEIRKVIKVVKNVPMVYG